MLLHSHYSINSTQQVIEDQIEADGEMAKLGIVLGPVNYWPGDWRHIT